MSKEVGGDLYSYLIQGDMLYFCVGDVSGKGVPSSLFMAQATQLFRTLAAQQILQASVETHTKISKYNRGTWSSRFFSVPLLAK